MFIAKKEMIMKRTMMWVMGVAVAMTQMLAVAQDAPMSEKAAQLEKQYTQMMERLKADLVQSIPDTSTASADALDALLIADKLDSKLLPFVVLHEGTPKGLAMFAANGPAEEKLIASLLKDPKLMRQMLVADGPARSGKGESGPAQYGPAMTIYSDIQQASSKASEGVLQRLAVAVSLVHAVPQGQRNAKAATDASKTVDPVKRYLSYEKAYLDGELDAAFGMLDTFNLRYVVDGEEPDSIAAWGREMLKNFRPDHVLNDNYGWRYVSVVPSEVRYGSGDVKFDRPELQFFQNILMNGGVCGRRAFFGRFILRAFGIPTTARPSRGHAALCHWTPKGWVVNLGPHWGGGWTKTAYHADKDFLASTQARVNQDAYLKVKRAMWIGDVMGETRVYGENAGQSPAFWNALSLKTQRKVIDDSKAVTLEALGAHLGESSQTVAEAVKAEPVSPEDKMITYADNGDVIIPAVAYVSAAKDVKAMKSFSGGMQIFLPRFSRQGLTLMRGGAWRGDADSCRSGWRMPSSGYGRYNNWGFRAAMSPAPGQPRKDITLDLGNGVTMDMVYIKPGTFIMGGTNTKDSKWHAVEVPKHEVEITKGYYLGKYEVTQAQFKQIMGTNPSKANKNPNAPADNVSEGDAVEFCQKASIKTGQNVRLPTEAEWEYAARAGTTTSRFFGDDASKLDDYAWYKDNDGGSSHPVGQKKPNPWGLYDIYGNVCERVSDVYNKNYYKNSPRKDPTGPMQGEKSQLAYTLNVPKAGKYALTAQVVTANYDQMMVITVNGEEQTLEMPFTKGAWQDTKPIVVELQKGANTLKFLRRDPPQYGVAVKSFRLQPKG
jgi:formylglycine-generating enzyme required for sulfatase activity